MRLVNAVLCVGFLAACSSTSEAERIYLASMADYERNDGTGGLDPEVVRRQRERFAELRAAHAAGRLDTLDERTFGAATLVKSDAFDDLECGLDLAHLAAEAGDPRALSLLAECTDRLLMKRDRPQRYGTQYVYDPRRHEWRLYDVDPATTDEQRAEVGLPPLAELRARAGQLDETTVSTRLRGSTEPE